MLNNVSDNQLNVLMVGCGNIAGSFDADKDLTSMSFTHAGAYKSDGRFNIVACVDPNDVSRSAFMQTWDVPYGYHSITDFLNSDLKFDVISICSPTAFHAKDVKSALTLKPKLLFCEKPFTDNLEVSKKLIDESTKLNVLLAVNHTRRWDPDVEKLKQDITSHRWGELRSVVGFYNKGILNNGSHLIDLLHFLLGELDVVKVGKPINDYSEVDPTIPVWLEGPKSIPIFLSTGHAADFTIFELQFLFSNGMLTMEEGGISWRERHITDSTFFKDYQVLDGGRRKTGRYQLAMKKAVDNIYNAIEHNAALQSSGETALAAQVLCEKIRFQSINTLNSN